MPLMRAAGLVKSTLIVQKSFQRQSSSEAQRSERNDNEASTRLSPGFHGVCDLPAELSVVIGIRDRMSKCVYYKDDEDRFRQRYTLKLKTFTDYGVQMEVSPPLAISFLKLGGIRYDANMIKMKVEDGKTFCTFTWSTKHFKTTQRKYRSILPCVIKFSGYKELHFEVVVKFYENEEIFHYSGVPLFSLEIFGTQFITSNDKQQKGQMCNVVFN